jgi:N-acetylmuramoyl-L-alanine amidase
MKIIIDAGHGGADPGGGSNSLWKEKDMALKISLYQYERCKKLGIDVELTRNADTYLTPPYRANLIKNSKAKYCFSNHINASAPNARGCEVITSIYNDKVLANKIYSEMKTIIPGRRVFDRRNDAGQDYYFIHRLTGDVTTFIIEYGFATNADDTNILKDKWQDLAECVLKALCEHEGILYHKSGEKVENVNLAVEKWKSDNLKYLVDNKMVSDYDGWLKKIDEPMPAWAVFSILANMHKVLQEKK